MIFAERARPRPQEDITPEPEHGEDGDLNVEDTITQEREDDDHVDDGDNGDNSEDVSDSDEGEDSLATTSQSDQADTASSSGNTFQVNA